MRIADSTRLWCSSLAYTTTLLCSVFSRFFSPLCLDNAVTEMRKTTVPVLASASEYAGGVCFAGLLSVHLPLLDEVCRAMTGATILAAPRLNSSSGVLWKAGRIRLRRGWITDGSTAEYHELRSSRNRGKKRWITYRNWGRQRRSPLVST
jgi:hypothetical protein